MERIIRPAEGAQLLGIGISTLYEWLANPTSSPKPLPPLRQVGPRAVGWTSSEFDSFIKELPPVEALPRVKRK